MRHCQIKTLPRELVTPVGLLMKETRGPPDPRGIHGPEMLEQVLAN
jgi:hypothetical protein